MAQWRDTLRKIYHFLFVEDSLLSWIVNIILAFIIVKFVIYPGLSLLLGTSLPLVAVISGSMEHEGLTFDAWWAANGAWYEARNITKEQFFQYYPFVNGFNKGDVMVLGRATNAGQGDVLVYTSGAQRYPIIHRVIYINEDDATYTFKGDNNKGPDPAAVVQSQIVGRALYRIPYIGWVKIWFTQLLGL